MCGYSVFSAALLKMPFFPMGLSSYQESFVHGSLCLDFPFYSLLDILVVMLVTHNFFIALCLVLKLRSLSSAVYSLNTVLDLGSLVGFSYSLHPIKSHWDSDRNFTDSIHCFE